MQGWGGGESRLKRVTGEAPRFLKETSMYVLSFQALTDHGQGEWGEEHQDLVILKSLPRLEVSEETCQPPPFISAGDQFPALFLTPGPY